jgi:hypothetical protein
MAGGQEPQRLLPTSPMNTGQSGFVSDPETTISGHHQWCRNKSDLYGLRGAFIPIFCCHNYLHPYLQFLLTSLVMHSSSADSGTCGPDMLWPPHACFLLVSFQILHGPPCVLLPLCVSTMASWAENWLCQLSYVFSLGRVFTTGQHGLLAIFGAAKNKGDKYEKVYHRKYYVTFTLSKSCPLSRWRQGRGRIARWKKWHVWSLSGLGFASPKEWEAGWYGNNMKSKEMERWGLCMVLAPGWRRSMRRAGMVTTAI